MSQSIQTATTISFGYSDSEDRIWVRCVGSNFEERYWLTRALTKKIITTACEILDQNTPDQREANIGYILKKFQSIADTPTPQLNLKKIGSPRLCHSVDLKVSPNSWLIIWKSQDSSTSIETIGLTKDFIYALYVQSLIGKWDLVDENHWLTKAMQEIHKLNNQKVTIK